MHPRSCPRPHFLSSTRQSPFVCHRSTAVFVPLSLTNVRSFAWSQPLSSKAQITKKKRQTIAAASKTDFNKPPISPVPAKSSKPLVSQRSNSASTTQLERNDAELPSRIGAYKATLASRQDATPSVIDPSNPFPDPLNPPSTTIPPPLEVPSREDFNQKWRYWYASGKAYVRFYKTGLKNLWGNRKIYRALKGKPLLIKELESGQRFWALWTEKPPARLLPTPPDLSDVALTATEGSFRAVRLSGNLDYKKLAIEAGVKNHGAEPKSPTADIAQRGLDYTRAEFQFSRRTSRDLRRLVPFGMILIVLGEWTPLIVAFLTPIVPRNCWTPGQERKAIKKIEKARYTERILRDRLFDRKPAPGINNLPTWVARLRKELLPGRLVSSNLRKGYGIPANEGASLSVFRKWLYYSPAFKQVSYLDVDDALIRKYGGVGGMSWAEVRLAAVERSIDVLDRPEANVRSDLEDWVKNGGWRTMFNWKERYGKLHR